MAGNALQSMVRSRQLKQTGDQAQQEVQQAQAEVQQYEQGIKQYEKDFQNYLQTDSGKMQYVQESGIKPSGVIYGKLGKGYSQQVFAKVYDTPYGQVTDRTPEYEARAMEAKVQARDLGFKNVAEMQQSFAMAGRTGNVFITPSGRAIPLNVEGANKLQEQMTTDFSSTTMRIPEFEQKYGVSMVDIVNKNTQDVYNQALEYHKNPNPMSITITTVGPTYAGQPNTVANIKTLQSLGSKFTNPFISTSNVISSFGKETVQIQTPLNELSSQVTLNPFKIITNPNVATGIETGARYLGERVSSGLTNIGYKGFQWSKGGDVKLLNPVQSGTFQYNGMGQPIRFTEQNITIPEKRILTPSQVGKGVETVAALSPWLIPGLEFGVATSYISRGVQQSIKPPIQYGERPVDITDAEWNTYKQEVDSYNKAQRIGAGLDIAFGTLPFAARALKPVKEFVFNPRVMNAKVGKIEFERIFGYAPTKVDGFKAGSKTIVLPSRFKEFISSKIVIGKEGLYSSIPPVSFKPANLKIYSGIPFKDRTGYNTALQTLTKSGYKEQVARDILRFRRPTYNPVGIKAVSFQDSLNIGRYQAAKGYLVSSGYKPAQAKSMLKLEVGRGKGVTFFETKGTVTGKAIDPYTGKVKAVKTYDVIGITGQKQPTKLLDVSLINEEMSKQKVQVESKLFLSSVEPPKRVGGKLVGKKELATGTAKGEFDVVSTFNKEGEVVNTAGFGRVRTNVKDVGIIGIRQPSKLVFNKKVSGIDIKAFVEGEGKQFFKLSKTPESATSLSNIISVSEKGKPAVKDILGIKFTGELIPSKGVSISTTSLDKVRVKGYNNVKSYLRDYKGLKVSREVSKDTGQTFVPKERLYRNGEFSIDVTGQPNPKGLPGAKYPEEAVKNLMNWGKQKPEEVKALFKDLSKVYKPKEMSMEEFRDSTEKAVKNLNDWAKSNPNKVKALFKDLNRMNGPAVEVKVVEKKLTGIDVNLASKSLEQSAAKFAEKKAVSSVTPRVIQKADAAPFYVGGTGRLEETILKSSPAVRGTLGFEAEVFGPLTLTRPDIKVKDNILEPKILTRQLGILQVRKLNFDKLDMKLEQRMLNEKLDARLDNKLQERLQQKLDKKLEQKLNQKMEQKLSQRELLKLQTPQIRVTTRTPKPREIKKPKKLDLPFPTFEGVKKKRRELEVVNKSKANSYELLTRVKGKETLIGSRLTKQAALDIGTATTLFGKGKASALSASIILRASKEKAVKVSTRGEFAKFGGLFREGKVKGKGAEITLVQKERARLNFQPERLAITKSRRGGFRI
jgi:hypothetical protein